jgi:lysophospholipase L1-like esterase
LKKGGEKMYLCFGDSITKGVPGVSYLKYLDKKQKYKNFGLGGDTIIGLSKRIKGQLEKNEYKNYIIQIGTNDILLPFLSRYSQKWNTQVNNLMKNGRLPCNDIQQFEEKYRQLLSELLNADKSITVINIPCIGENADSELNRKVDAYNLAIKDVANDFNVGLIDFNGWQKNILNQYSIVEPYFITKEPLDMVLDSLLTPLSLLRKKISNKRGLNLTVDGCHLNDIGARGLAELVQDECGN